MTCLGHLGIPVGLRVLGVAIVCVCVCVTIGKSMYVEQQEGIDSYRF